MLALAAGFLLVAYLLAPGAIYRLAFSFYIPSKRFQRTRTEEVVFSAIAVSAPFLLSWALLCHTSLGHIPELHSQPSKTGAYTVVFGSLLSDDHKTPSTGEDQAVTSAYSKLKASGINRNDPLTLESAYRRVLREQARFIVWLWVLCAIEGALLGRLVSRYGRYSDHSVPKWLCDRFLLRHVSEWQVLFTTIALPEEEREKSVEIDVLCAGTLYRGRLVDWFTDQEGKLAGIFLTEASRFRKEDFDRDKLTASESIRDKYWRSIPGAKLYLAASFITNYNIRYVESLRSASEKLSKELGSAINLIPLSSEPSKEPSGIFRKVGDDEIRAGSPDA